jgi:hypothetical protein
VASVPFVPEFAWRESKLYECAEYDTISPTVCKTYLNADGPPRTTLPAYKTMACHTDSSGEGSVKKTYSCINPTEKGCVCSSECDDLTIGETTFPKECYPIAFSIEDTWTIVPTYIRHNNGDGTFSDSEQMSFDGNPNQGDLTYLQVIINS